MSALQFEARKRDHIQHALSPNNQTQGLSFLDKIHLHHNALPELDFDEVRLDSTCLKTILPTPFYVAGMTAGHPDAFGINRTLARACTQRGWAMGVGSQRRQLDAPFATPYGGDQWQKLREEVPSLTLFANLGLSQLVTTPIEKILNLVQSIQAQALVIHTNALQECLQPEGTPKFRGGIRKLTETCKELEIPIVLKETGCGFSIKALKLLVHVGLSALDVSGLGGTHWGRIEGARAREINTENLQARASETFSNWGEPTALSVQNASQILPDLEIWASGGVRSGLDAAKLIALGAHRVGYAKPALEAALLGSETLLHWMELQEFELKTALFCTGFSNPEELRLHKEDVWTLT